MSIAPKHFADDFPFNCPRCSSAIRGEDAVVDPDYADEGMTELTITCATCTWTMSIAVTSWVDTQEEDEEEVQH